MIRSFGHRVLEDRIQPDGREAHVPDVIQRRLDAGKIAAVAPIVVVAIQVSDAKFVVFEDDIDNAGFGVHANIEIDEQVVLTFHTLDPIERHTGMID